MSTQFVIKKGHNWPMMLCIRTLLLFCLSMVMMENAYALKCVNAGDQSFKFTENIGSVVVPVTAADGTLIWRSENRTMAIQCWKDYGTGGGEGSKAEPVYVYFNPAGTSLGQGIQVGMNFGGVNVPDIMSASRITVPGVIVPACSNSESVCKANYSVRFTVSYYVYINKKGVPSGSNYSGPNTLDVFQLDGAGGLNMTPNSNFRYATTNMQGIRFASCEANLSVTPNQVDFGSVVAVPNSTGTMAAEKEFTVNVLKSCNDPFKLTATYSSPSNKLDNNTLSVLEGVGIKIKNLMTGNYIQYSDVENFADLTNTNNVSVPFSAQMFWMNNTPALGNVNTALTITVYYN
ncbi:fimbrial protein [Limnobaculum zhutongyuii]|uniref:Fimbrial protein n=1 Tax=Limnobaculum zhutongyuii TaxID=2498113 RepID=A0A411WN41_9GAMM|nr:fimbrial protein [Limnobaculum zhutongyuii]QBH97634.1 fimbrial protein [Limnobaculum zhutongyuii]TQS91107.1 fimbrial protein [Limnobaculum zhutongyuii]